jgi:CBS domain-containing protein
MINLKNMRTIGEIMMTTPKYCTRYETLKNISSQMYEINIGAMPVVDENKKVVGMITDRDLALAFGKVNKLLSEYLVQDVMTSTVYTVGPEDSLATALKIMRSHKVSRLPVIDKEQKLIGKVSLNLILRSSYGSDEAYDYELEFAGEENILNTLYYLAKREANYPLEAE